MLPTHIDFGVVGQLCEYTIQCFVHFFWCPLKEATTSANEQGVTCEDHLVIAIFEVIADAVLRVAWRVKRLHLDAADVEGRAMIRSLRHLRAVLATDNRKLVVLELWQFSHGLE